MDRELFNHGVYMARGRKEVIRSANVTHIVLEELYNRSISRNESVIKTRNSAGVRLSEIGIKSMIRYPLVVVSVLGIVNICSVPDTAFFEPYWFTASMLSRACLLEPVGGDDEEVPSVSAVAISMTYRMILDTLRFKIRRAFAFLFLLDFSQQVNDLTSNDGTAPYIWIDIQPTVRRASNLLKGCAEVDE